MKHLFDLGIGNAIINNLKSRPDFAHETDGVLEIQCGPGQLASMLHSAGVKKYHGTDASEQNIKAAKAAVKPFARRFHLADPFSPEALEYKGEIIVATTHIPFDSFKSGQRVIIVTTGFSDWDSACLALTPRFEQGATTVQFSEYFLTIGTIK
jgi:hypothetical protein